MIQNTHRAIPHILPGILLVLIIAVLSTACSAASPQLQPVSPASPTTATTPSPTDTISPTLSPAPKAKPADTDTISSETLEDTSNITSTAAVTTSATYTHSSQIFSIKPPVNWTMHDYQPTQGVLIRWVDPEGISICTVAIVKKDTPQTPEELTSSLLQFIAAAFETEANFEMDDPVSLSSSKAIMVTATYSQTVDDEELSMVVIGKIAQHQDKVSLLTATIPASQYDAEAPNNIINQFLNSYEINPDVAIPGWEQVPANPGTQ